jgi:hypothetical protein
MAGSDFHEDYGRGGAVRTSSDRGFGVVFAVVFGVVGGWPLLGGGSLRPWALAVASGFLLMALVGPGLLAPLNRQWTALGLLLHKITNPLIMGLVFYLAVTPTALALRLLGKDPLNRRFDAEAESYWIERTPPGPEPDTMKQQF